MGTIQNSMNGMLGAVAGAATLSKHISNQNKELIKQDEANKLHKAQLEVEKIEEEKKLKVAQNELEKNNFTLSTQMKTDKDLTEEQRNELKGLEAGKDIDRYLEMKSDRIEKDAVAAESEFNDRMAKYNSGEQKSFPSSKRFEMMKQALQESNDEVTARETLIKNVELQMKKLEALKGVK